MNLLARITLLDGATMPEYKTTESVGFDLGSNELDVVTVRPGAVKMIRTGVIIQPPDGYFTAIFARSSLQKMGLMLANNVGIVDPDYCGPEDEIKLAIYNFGQTVVVVSPGQRLAQGVFLPYGKASFVSEILGGPSRGGFGSTGR